MTNSSWPALALARRRDAAARIPFVLREGDAGAECVLGSVATAHLPALRAWPDAFEELPPARPGAWPRALALRLPRAGRDERLAQIHACLHADGLLRGWRDEIYPLRDRSGREHGAIERAAGRFWGLLTLGAHCNGYLADARGRPTHLWIARRADTKATDPGRLDNLVGGGVPRGQTPREAVIREGWEEAGLEPGQMAGLVTGSVIELDGDVAEGRQHEHLHVFDLALAPDFHPRAVDGEVAAHCLMTVEESLARAAAGELTTDAALAVLDFSLRHRLLDEPLSAGEASTLAWRAQAQVTPGQVQAFEALKLSPARAR